MFCDFYVVCSDVYLRDATFCSSTIYIHCKFPGNCLEFASYYQDGMVLQREPASAVIWGTGELLGELEAVLECSLQGIQTIS
jgi:hypothetical protein